MNTIGIARRDEATAEWFDALAEDRLVLRVCPEGHYSRPDVLACDVCRASSLAWGESSGGGRVVSIAVDHTAGTTLVVVELVEGPWLVTRLEGPSVSRGDRVVFRFVHPEEGEAYPVAAADRPSAQCPSSAPLQPGPHSTETP